jgi:hypothetical protein
MVRETWTGAKVQGKEFSLAHAVERAISTG